MEITKDRAHRAWRIAERVTRLNKLGFDIEELAIKTDDAGTKVRIEGKSSQPQVIHSVVTDAKLEPARPVAPANGTLEVTFDLPNPAVSLIELVPASPDVPVDS